MAEESASYVGAILFMYWQRGVDFGHGYYHGKIDPAVLIAEAREIVEIVAQAAVKDFRQAKATPERGPWRICDRHGFSSPLADLDACPDCYLSPEIRAHLRKKEEETNG